MQSKLNLDFSLVDKGRASAGKIADDMQKFIDQHTTVTVERSVLRLLGVDGVDDLDRPLPNVIQEQLSDAGVLNMGASYWMGNAMIQTGKMPQEIAEMVGRGEINITELPQAKLEDIRETIQPIAVEMTEKVRKNRQERERMLVEVGEGPKPYLYVIVATGNIYEDVLQAQAAARQGADIIAVIRTTGQSLLDYVPYGATTEGFGGTYATQENFRIMRKALDEVGEEVGKYIRLCNYCSGLCMPEIAAMGAIERLDVMLNDALYGILFRDINMQRTLVDQYFSRVINGFAGIIINTGEDNYLTTADAVEEAHTVLASQFINEQFALKAGIPEEAHTVLASQFINEQFALKAGIPEEQMGLGHAFEMNPDIENGFLMELAQAQMAREIFPNAPLKYMPPTKYMTGDIFKGHVQDALFNMVAIMTDQSLQLLGMPTEAIHTPLLQDRKLSIDNAKYIFSNMRNLGEEIEYKQDGLIQKRAQKVVGEAVEMLHDIEEKGLFDTIIEGKFAGVKRPFDGGKGLKGTVTKDENYFNPFIPLMLGGER